MQQEEYYPFGLTFNIYQRENSLLNNYQYNGKEKQDELELGWLDYGARMYMSEIGRWHGIDPLSEEFHIESPYNFVHNNPLKFIDPDGRGPKDVIVNVSDPTVVGSTLEKRTANVTITLTVVNPGGKVDLSGTMFSKGKGSIDMTGTFGGRALGKETISGNSVDTDYDITGVTLKYNVVNSLDDAGKDDHIMMLVNDIPEGKYGPDGETSNPVGLAEKGGRVSAVESGTIGDGSFNNVATHELGHNLGMPDLKNSPEKLMNGKALGGTKSIRTRKRPHS